MRALRFEKTGSLDALQVQDILPPAPGEGEVLVEVAAAAVNPSDIRNVLGGMHETTLPRTPGRDFAGTIARGPASLLGKSVFGSGGDLGFRRDGSHAQFVAVPESAVVLTPRTLSPVQAAALGVPCITAWAALMNVANLRRAESVLITGAGGAVGSAAVRIARSHGAFVVGTVRKQADIAAVHDLPVDVWIDLQSSDLPQAVRAATRGKGADVVLDLVGGSLFEKCLASLAWRGRQVAVASPGEPRVNFNLIDFYHNESRLFGLDTLKVSFEEAGNILRVVAPRFESGEFPPPSPQAFPLDEAPEIYRQIRDSKLKGKVVLIP